MSEGSVQAGAAGGKGGLWAQSGSVVAPYERNGGKGRRNPIDDIVFKGLKTKGLQPAKECSDEVFFRRVHLDVTGALPPPEEVGRFLQDKRPTKRGVLINSLLKKAEFADYWSLKWCDLLRVKAEFPINLWPNGVQAYHRWIYDALQNGMGYDQFVRELLTSSGSNFRVPAVNFYRAVQGQKPERIAAAVALTFMGVRLEKWPKEQQDNMAGFFSRIVFKGTAEWKEQIVTLDPAPHGSLEATFPDGGKVVIRPEEDPRKVFADWLIREDNPWFARNIVNRIWSWLLGRGIIHEPDDIRADNPPVYPELLSYLEKQLVQEKYDLRHIYKLILNSGVYQQSSIPAGDAAKAEAAFACYPVRRLDAEVLVDALCWITGTKENYSSPIPEPFTFVPPEHRSIELSDGSITSAFLEMFGRPARDTGLEAERNNQPSEAQRLHLLNSTHIQKKIENSWRLNELLRSARGNRGGIIDEIYLNVLSRSPLPEERETALAYFRTDGLKQRQAAVDLIWALINTKEFLYRH